MSGTLYVVATPIGNLEDITLRALRVLREADLIAAEDTRHTAKLLTHHGVSAPTISFHQHNTRTRIPQLMRELQAGKQVALVTDAGTPGVSDPGVELIQACIEGRVAVDPIPGASAPIVAALASGFPLIPLTIFGFAPSKAKERAAWLESISSTPHTCTFFEAPHRIGATLDEAAHLFGDRPISIGRELTKMHQQFIRGTARSVLDEIIDPKGEFTVVVGPALPTERPSVAATDADIAAEFGVMTNARGYSRRDAVAAVANRFGISNKSTYEAIERTKRSVECPQIE